MKSMKITVYTIPDCPFCKQTKDYLTAKGLPFDEKDVLNNKDFLAEMLQKSQNFAGVPFTLIEEGGTSMPLKGFTQSEFDEALSKVGGSDTTVSASIPAATSPQPPKIVSDPSIGMPKAAASKPLDPMAATPMNQPTPTGMGGTDPVNMDLDMSKPVQPDTPKPTATFQAAPTMPNATSNSQPLSTPPMNDDPQKELNSLLEDLQTKVDVADLSDVQPAAPAPAGSAPVMPAAQSPVEAPSAQTPTMASPAMPSMPSMSATEPAAAAAPVLPDFSKPQ